MRTFFLFILCCLFACVTKAQQSYDISLIPKDLMAYAHSVVRYSNESVLVSGLDNTTFHIKKAITVLNKNGDVNIVVWHNKSNTIKYIKGAIYDAGGKLIKKFTERNFEDVYAGNDFSLFEDSRVEHFMPANPDYPYTVEYEYEIHATQSLVFGDWSPNSVGVAVEKSVYSFTCKPDFKINYKEINTPQKAGITTDTHGLVTYTWEADHLKAFKYEPFSPDNDKFLTIVKIAPEHFEYEGLTGSFTNWQELGKWNYDNLLTGRDRLPQTTVDFIKQLTANITDPKLKAKKIYEYMQQKTRYISIQVGIGGYQPFLAADVDKTGYGDCKALVNYTNALLKVANINSYYCVVNSGSRKISMMPDFASMAQGDHVILCIPFKNDTTWLECTSQQMPFGFLSNFTDDRWVLACTPDGGKLLHTPRYTREMNLTKRIAEFNIDTTGTLSGIMTTKFGGTDFDERDRVIDEAYTEQLKSIGEIYPINNLHINRLKYSKDKSIIPVTTESIQLNAPDYASPSSGKRYFKVNTTSRPGYVPDEVRNRTTDVYINRGYTEETTITYTLPAGYHTDKPLWSKTMGRPFGRFSVKMTVNGRQLIYKRFLQINDGTYSKDDYQDLISFYQAVSDADGYTMAYVKDN